MHEAVHLSAFAAGKLSSAEHTSCECSTCRVLLLSNLMVLPHVTCRTGRQGGKSEEAALGSSSEGGAPERRRRRSVAHEQRAIG